TVPFKENDLDPSSVSGGDFYVVQEVTTAGGAKQDVVAFPEGEPIVSADHLQVTLNFRNLNPGDYKIAIAGLTDIVGNDLAKPTPGNALALDNAGFKTTFTVPGGRQRGEQVEFPRFLSPENKSDEFNPGDLVDTRVVQLYYFRDARRVAELINRNVRSLNQVGYDDAQRVAREARIKAEDAVDGRRYKETVAYEAAQKTREAQRQLQQAQQDLAKLQQEQAELAVQEGNVKYVLDSFVKEGATGNTAALQVGDTEMKLTAKRAEIQQVQMADANDPTLPMLKQEEAVLASRLQVLRTLAVKEEVINNQKAAFATSQGLLESQIKSLPTQIQQYQQGEIDTREAVVKAEASELRTSQEQFRREVAASLTDPDTFVAGNVSSRDPVTQVSISVVGTSRLQLRGPIKGINKIRRMIHQIDSPVGQVKIGIHTVQVNGEHGDRMDFVYEKVNKEIAHSRFLVNTSGRLLRRAVQEVANEVAMAVDQGGAIILDCPPADLISMCQDRNAGFASLDGTVMTNQTLRDWRYLYAFYGADFIDELRRMDSELLNTENKMLSLHSMDTISLAGALSVASLADHPVRQQILYRFQELIASELPEREREYVQALTQVGYRGKQLSFWPNRAMKVDDRNAQEIYFNAQRTYHFPNTITFFNEAIPGQGTLNPVQYSTLKLAQALKAQLVAEMEYQNLVLERSLLSRYPNKSVAEQQVLLNSAKEKANREWQLEYATFGKNLSSTVRDASGVLQNYNVNETQKGDINRFLSKLADHIAKSDATQQIVDALRVASPNSYDEFKEEFLGQILEIVPPDLVNESGTDGNGANTYLLSIATLANGLYSDKAFDQRLRGLYRRYEVLVDAEKATEEAIAEIKKLKEFTYTSRLLEQFMDEQEEKSVALMEALREHSSNVDNYLKRVAIALEDDVQAQFYEPAFQRIRRVSRTWDVTLGQIETTTVLTNNRMLAKVSPAATFEFDLPHRDILLTEAIDGSKALVDEYGNLLKDPTFLAGAAALSGMPPTGVVGDNSPITGIPGLDQNPKFGSEFEKLIPDPAIYKFETGTGFEIRPIIQPDGHSIVYTFDYMYSTNVREPVRADEKHLGRIKRHFVHTDVQTSSYELREVSRYTVALKAARTERGVPLFEDIPGLGVLFRPLPSDESSLQTNIILASSTIYPTVFDLMGLRWSPYVDDLGSESLVNDKDEQTTRREELRTHLLEQTRSSVNESIGIPKSTGPRVIQMPSGFSTLP
ncbi:MAG: hypothetical protein KDA88_09390, partial [Planctomycetaceae bacterium]|nr:hypothetical protein [Planctomycetaceae bacterium]